MIKYVYIKQYVYIPPYIINDKVEKIHIIIQ